MKKKHLLFFIISLFLIPNFINAATKEEKLEALMETAKAYYNQGKQLQYDSYKKNLYATPEDATSMNYIYTVCSGFTFQSYYQTFGIKIPDTTSTLINYGKENEGTKNVILYLDNATEVSEALDIKITDEDETSGFVKYDLIDKYNIQVGDILVYQTKSGSGHSMLVTNVDKTNRKITITEGGGRTIKDEDEDYDKNGALSTKTLSYKVFKGKNKVAMIRIITDSDTYINKSGVSESYNLTNSAKSRLKYPDIEIGKIINNVSDQTYATFEDELTYQLKIKNNSNITYTNINVVENIDSRVKLLDAGTGTVSDNKINWTIESIEPGNSVTLLFKIKIPKNINLLGKIIESTGIVDNIPTSKIVTRIGNNLTSTESNNLYKKFLDSTLRANSKTGRDYINQLYKESFGIDLGITGLSNSNILTYNEKFNIIPSDDSSYPLFVNYTSINSKVFKHLYNNYYGLKVGDNADPDNKLVLDSKAWNIYADNTLKDRARTLLKTSLKDGDIILLKDNLAIGSNSYKCKSYIYFKDALYCKEGANSFETILDSDEYTSSLGFDTTKLRRFLRDVIGQNYVILRPTIPKIFELVISSKPTKTRYIQNYEKLDLSGGILKVTYNTAETKTVNFTDSNVTTTGFNNKNIGKNTIKVSYGGSSVSYDVDIVSKQISKIAITTKPIKSNYIQNYENLDLTGGILTVYYNDQSTDKISLTNSKVTVTGFNNKNIGKNTVTVTYEGRTVTFDVNIVSKQISKIAITTKPIKSNYIQNYEALDLTGGILSIYYNDNSISEISLTNSKVTVTGFNNKNIGKNTLTVTYEGRTVTFDINIVSKQITNISVSTLPLKKQYIQNKENLDLTGGVLKVSYDDNSEDKISLLNDRISVSGFNNSNVGTKNISVTYKDKETSFSIEIVSKSIDSISIDTAPTKTNYIQNYEELDLTGGIINVVYDDNSEDKISLDNTNIEISGFNNTKVGINTITATYEEKTSTFDVEIVSKQIKEILVSETPIKTNYIQNYEELDLTGGIIKILYNDNSSDEISMTNQNIEVSGFNNSIIGKNTLTITYEGRTTTFDIDIISKQIEKIEILKKPIKSNYIQNYEELDLSGGIIKVFYNDETTDEISTTYSGISVSGFDNSNIGKNTITITYGEKTTSFEIEIVSKQSIKIEIANISSKIKYDKKNNKYDFGDGVLIIHYNDGTTNTIPLNDESVISKIINKDDKNILLVSLDGLETSLDFEIFEEEEIENPQTGGIIVVIVSICLILSIVKFLKLRKKVIN